MSCEVYGKAILKNQEFILVGKYPGFYMRTYFFVNPEVHGRIYHRACFMEKVKEKITEKGGVEQLATGHYAKDISERMHSVPSRYPNRLRTLSELWSKARGECKVIKERVSSWKNHSSKSEQATRVNPRIKRAKVTVEITISPKILAEARKRNLNISRITEQALPQF